MRYRNQQYEPSQTAEWVAAARSLGAILPRELRLADDPFGISFAEGKTRRLGDALLRHPRLAMQFVHRAGPLASFVLWMQLRTRAIDDVLLDFVSAGGRQVVLLGAGYDCRALRFRHQLAQAAVYEVDHPATQRIKLRRLPVETVDGRVVYAGWDFEHNGASALPPRLRELGLDPSRPVLTIWEGVTMYVGEQVIDATVRAVREYGAEGSLLAVTYNDARTIARPRGEQRLFQGLAARFGEPWRFGFDPAEVPAWFLRRGYDTVLDVTDRALAERHYPKREARRFARGLRHIAVFRVRRSG